MQLAGPLNKRDLVTPIKMWQQDSHVSSIASVATQMLLLSEDVQITIVTEFVLVSVQQYYHCCCTLNLNI